MKLTDKHHDIIAFIHQAPRSKVEIIERFKSWYHLGKFASKYIPVQLNSLVNLGFLECKDGIYTTFIK